MPDKDTQVSSTNVEQIRPQRPRRLYSPMPHLETMLPSFNGVSTGPLVTKLLRQTRSHPAFLKTVRTTSLEIQLNLQRLVEIIQQIARQHLHRQFGQLNRTRIRTSPQSAPAVEASCGGVRVVGFLLGR